MFSEADKEESGGGVEILFDRLMLLDDSHYIHTEMCLCFRG